VVALLEDVVPKLIVVPMSVKDVPFVLNCQRPEVAPVEERRTWYAAMSEMLTVFPELGLIVKVATALAVTAAADEEADAPTPPQALLAAVPDVPKPLPRVSPPTVTPASEVVAVNGVAPYAVRPLISHPASTAIIERPSSDSNCEAKVSIWNVSTREERNQPNHPPSPRGFRRRDRLTFVSKSCRTMVGLRFVSWTLP
jgi:hypothetical protein